VVIKTLKVKIWKICILVIFMSQVVPKVQAEQYPQKPIRVIVPSPAGSATDYIARMIAQQLNKRTQQPVLVDNKPGANGFIAAQAVAKASPDGYTLLITANSTHAANSALFKKLPYDPVKDFSPITTIASSPLILVAAPGFEANSPSELARIAAAHPEKISFASGNAPSRIGGELFKMMAGINMLHVPYRGAPQALADVVGGQVSVMWTDLVTGTQLLQSGRVKAMAVTSRSRLRALPYVPTMTEAGYPGYVLSAWVGVFGPANMPAKIVHKLNELIHAGAREQESEIERVGGELLLTSPESFAHLQAADIAMWMKVTKAAGIEPE
jgi:tripartite-type tricarboxylate transporter receptor subunit TctC